MRAVEGARRQRSEEQPGREEGTKERAEDDADGESDAILQRQGKEEVQRILESKTKCM